MLVIKLALLGRLPLGTLHFLSLLGDLLLSTRSFLDAMDAHYRTILA